MFGNQFCASPNWPTANAHVIRRCRPPYHSPCRKAQLLLWRLLPLTNWRVSTNCGNPAVACWHNDGFRQTEDAVACQREGSVPVQVEASAAGKSRKRTVFRPPKKHSFPASLKRCAHGAMSCRKPTNVRKTIKPVSSFYSCAWHAPQRSALLVGQSWCHGQHAVPRPGLFRA